MSCQNRSYYPKAKSMPGSFADGGSHLSPKALCSTKFATLCSLALFGDVVLEPSVVVLQR